MDYTKGEWIATKTHNFTGTLVSYIYCGQKNIAQTRLSDNEATPEENQANAHLITAAPAMYEALASWGELWAMRPLDSGEDMQEILQRCWAKTEDALAKAEGK